VSQADVGDIGARIARYRKMNHWSARQLADHTDGTVSRDTIANIENGRRTDITVRQFLALALALRVPPAALLTDLEHPFEPSTIHFPGTIPAPLDDAAPAIAIARWLNGQTDDDTTPAARWVAHVTGLLTEYLGIADRDEVHAALGRIATLPTRSREEVEARRPALNDELLAAGVHLPTEPAADPQRGTTPTRG
jgi:transcriptional regulator with XRE-family HTH domain